MIEGWKAVDLNCLILNIFVKVFITWIIKSLPWCVWITLGQPKRVLEFSANAEAIV